MVVNFVYIGPAPYSGTGLDIYVNMHEIFSCAENVIHVFDAHQKLTVLTRKVTLKRFLYGLAWFIKDDSEHCT